MFNEEIFAVSDFQKCVEFHGHICPGLVVGYRAAKAGMAELREMKAEDEELVALVETDACSADAVQVLTGCTFGKGNFVYRDYGKQAFTLLSRKSGQGIRLAMKPGVLELSERHRELIRKMRAGEITPLERQEFEALHLGKSAMIMQLDKEKLFKIEKVALPIPPKAQIEPSRLCSSCGEPVMLSRLKESAGALICRACEGK